MPPPLLFCEFDMYAVAEHQKKTLRDALLSASESLSTSSDEEVIELYLRKYDVEVPTLDESKMEVEDDEVEIDVSRDSRRVFFDHSGPFYVKATRLTVHVPFTGEGFFFKVRPSTFSLSPPRGEVQSNELLLIYEFANDSPPPDVRGQIDRDLNDIKNHLIRLNESVAMLRNELRPIAAQSWQQRKSQFASKTQVIAGLGLPRRAESAPTPPRIVRASKPPKVTPRRAMNQDPISTHPWKVFISHASEDKDEVAKPLADALIAKGLSVWYDDYALNVGDSLRQKIDEGLAKSEFGIVILSKAFFAKHWPQQELNGLASREVRGKKVILPVWHNISRDEVSNESPTLADRLGVPTASGISTIVQRLLRAME